MEKTTTTKRPGFATLPTIRPTKGSCPTCGSGLLRYAGWFVTCHNIVAGGGIHRQEA